MRQWFSDHGVAEGDAPLLIDRYMAGPPVDMGRGDPRILLAAPDLE